ncbi:hypothetical protein H9W95_08600 [Flavobacterium lindanitolerans]|nr:hypothetical protein [Flavobacterium lindanitolerans]
MLGGFVIAQYGVHEVIWLSVPLLLLAFGFTFITLEKKHKEVEQELEAEPVKVVSCE